jgi:hypothetical protein
VRPDAPPDPADKGADQFVSRRAGYQMDRVDWLLAYLDRNTAATLASGEGGLLARHIHALRDENAALRDENAELRADLRTLGLEAA